MIRYAPILPGSREDDLRKISDTIARLATAKTRTGAAPHQGTRLVSLSNFGSNPGDLKGWASLPAGVEGRMPLVVVLHGCTQTAAGYDQGSGWSQLADRHCFALLYPEQQRTNNANLCFDWFVPGDTRRDSGEAGSIRQMIDALVAAGRIDAGRIFVTGLSAGGAMASAMLAAYPEVFAGGAIIAGLPYGVAGSIPEAFDQMQGHRIPSASALQDLLTDASDHDGPWPTVSVWHGTADNTVAYANADAIVAQWQAVHGLPANATQSDLLDGYPRRRWQDREGRVLIEAISITGMGHGTPLAAAGPDAIGAAGPFMLDVGISSTLRIAQSWGIVADAIDQTGKASRPPGAGSVAAEKQTPTGITAARARPVPGKTADPAHAGESTIGTRIDDALRAAGLMR